VRLARESGDAALHGAALVFLGYAESYLGIREAVGHLQEGLAIVRAVGDLDDLVLALNVALSAYMTMGDLATPRAVLTECLAIARELGDDWGIAVALDSAGFLDLRERDWSAAKAHLEQSLAMHRRLGDEGSAAIIYNNLAQVARRQGDAAGAVALLEQSLALGRRMGQLVAITLYNLGDWALRRGEIPRAMAYLAESFRESARSGERRSFVSSLGGLARLAVAVGQPDVAARLIGAAEALREQADVNLSLEFQRELARASDLARLALGEATFGTLGAEGANTPLDRLAAEALAWVESLPAPAQDGGPTVAPHPAPPDIPGGLSPREVEVLRLIAGGKGNREIADALVISLNTVARHVSNIFDKVGAANRTEAAAFAHRHGLAP
jgi:DNA-binding CsgD family transcriptional regulator/tetratricopeptide (TPR) repeat protein